MSRLDPGGKHVSRQNIGVFDLLFVREGCLYIGEEERHYEVRQGDALILRPDSYHYAIQECDAMTSYYWLHFQTTGSWSTYDAKLPALASEQQPEANPYAVWSYSTYTSQILIPSFIRVFDRNRTEELFDQLVKLNESFYSSGANWQQQLIFQQILRELSTSIEKEESTSPVLTCANRAAAYIRMNYKERITLQTLGEELNFHPVYIARCMRKVFGVTPMEYVLSQRIEQAKLLLLQTDYTVARIAEDVGFNQAAYFTACFSRAEGISPRNYRLRYAFG
ncbi:helix-turn-helix transcriptional regulator [Paenibacillus cellulosilyticus]|nr:AraC family transcriptional regulator [Paenibacillus cellulosilyticus]